jgi:ankyrin repeat protein
MKPSKALAGAAVDGGLKTMRAMTKKDEALAADWQPILDACLAGRDDSVALLLQHGADPNVKSKSAHQYRPLHRTVEYKKTMPKHDGHHRTVDVLLAAGADPMMQGSYWGISATTL